MDYTAIISSLANNQASIEWSLPVLTIVGTFIIHLLIISLIKIPRKSQIIRYIPIAGLLTALYLNDQLMRLPEVQTGIFLFNNLIQLNAWAIGFYQLLMFIACILLGIPITPDTSEDLPHNLYPCMLLGSLIGAYGLVMANHWLVVYLGITLISTCSAVLIYTNPLDKSSASASFNYFIYQALASSLMLWGLSYLYIMDGLTIKPAIITHMLGSPLCLIGLGLSLSAVFLQLGVFPFHFWIPPVYNTAPIPVITYLAIIPKLSALALLARLYQAYVPTHPYSLGIQNMLAVIAIISLVIGHLGALQTSQPRLILAYGSIAQSGLLLACVIVSIENKAILGYYSLFYGLANLAAWMSLQILEDKKAHKHLNDYAGMGMPFPAMSIGLCIGLFSLIGLPPTGGIIGKWLLFTNLGIMAYNTHNALLALLWLIGLLGSILSLYYYLKLPYVLFFKSGFVPRSILYIPTITRIIVIASSILLIVIFLYASKVCSLWSV